MAFKSLSIEKSHKVALAVVILILLGIAFLINRELSTKFDATLTSNNRVELKVAFAPYTANLPLLVADKQKYFSSRGLDVSLIELKDGNEMLLALENKSADIAAPIPLVNILNAHLASPDSLRLVWVGLEEAAGAPVSAMITSTNSPIESIDDLKGKKVAAFASAPSAIGAVKLILEKRGVTNATIIGSNPASVILQVEQRDVDAAFVIEPLFSIAKARGSIRILLTNPRAKLIHDPYVVGGLALPASILRDPRKRAAAGQFTKALVDGAKWIELHPKEARVLLSQYVNYTPEQLEHSGSYKWSCLTEKMVQVLKTNVLILDQMAAISKTNKTGGALKPLDLDLLINERELCQEDGK